MIAKEDIRALLWATFLSSLMSLSYFTLAWLQDKNLNERDSLTLLKLSDTFNHSYSLLRTENMPVPATFRRMGIERFNALPGRNNDIVVLWPGQPGFEMNRTTNDPRLIEILNTFIDTPEHSPIYEQFFIDKKIIGRTVLPSIANDQSCVDCHNQSLGKDVYSLGDVMGISVVERDMTPLLYTDLKYAGGIFVLTFMVAFLFSKRERKRNNNIATLEARVEIEKLKVEAEEKEKFLLRHDPLTGLPNRQLFYDFLKSSTASDGNSALHVALIDLDDFKMTNDTLGHDAGDALLVAVAQRLSPTMTQLNGVAARLGGDEFAIAWKSHSTTSNSAPASSSTSSPPSTAEQLASKILADVMKPLRFEKALIKPKCSIGVAKSTDKHTDSLEALIKRADIALYVAKDSGKSTFQLYNEEINSQIQRAKELSSEIVHCIEHNALSVALRPRVKLSDGQLLGFEAFPRWRLKGHDIEAKEFIAIAEKTGLVHELEFKVVRASVAFAKTVYLETGQLLSVSVNLSPCTMRSSTLISDIERLLNSAQLPHQCLTIEVSEHTLLSHLHAIQTVVNKLSNAGFRIALDDFSNAFSHLISKQFDQVIVDKNFVPETNPEPLHGQPLKYLSDLATSLDIELIVKGLDNQAQWQGVKEAVSANAQGLYISQHTDLRDIEACLSKTMLDTEFSLSIDTTPNSCKKTE